MVKQDLHGFYLKGAYYEGIHPSSYPKEYKKSCIDVMESHTRPIPDNHPLKYQPVAPLNELPIHYPVCNCKCGHDTPQRESPMWMIVGGIVALLLVVMGYITIF